MADIKIEKQNAEINSVQMTLAERTRALRAASQKETQAKIAERFEADVEAKKEEKKQADLNQAAAAIANEAALAGLTTKDASPVVISPVLVELTQEFNLQLASIRHDLHDSVKRQVEAGELSAEAAVAIDDTIEEVYTVDSIENVYSELNTEENQAKDNSELIGQFLDLFSSRFVSVAERKAPVTLSPEIRNFSNTAEFKTANIKAFASVLALVSAINQMNESVSSESFAGNRFIFMPKLVFRGSRREEDEEKENIASFTFKN